jgi:hypothetical protein
VNSFEGSARACRIAANADKPRGPQRSSVFRRTISTDARGAFRIGSGRARLVYQEPRPFCGAWFEHSSKEFLISIHH